MPLLSPVDLATMATSGAAPFLLTPIDNVLPRSHVPIFHFLPEPENSDTATTANALRRGLSQLLQGVPLFSGTLKATGQRGRLCVTAPYNKIEDLFHVKDLSHESGLDYQDLESKHFPNEALVDLVALLPLASMMKSKPPVILVQLNIIKGGMIMAMCVHHSFTDGNGTIVIARLWAAYCRGEDGSRLVTGEMINRERLMRGWGSASLNDVPEIAMVGILQYLKTSVSTWLTRFLLWLMARLGRTTLRTKRSNAKAPAKGSQRQVATFFFSKTKLFDLKRMASAKKTDEDKDVWISTNDALCALIACCRISSADDQDQQISDRCTLHMVVDVRRALSPPLPADYIGNALTSAAISFPSQSIVSTPAKVSELAHTFRKHIAQCDERYVRKRIAAILSVGDLSKLISTPPSRPKEHIVFSSWAKQQYHDISWGDVVGTSIKRTRFRSGGLIHCIILPELSAPTFAEEDCGLEVVLELERGEMERLKQNELFMRFAQWRCN